jgi:hypothetical protein
MEAKEKKIISISIANAGWLDTAVADFYCLLHFAQ